MRKIVILSVLVALIWNGYTKFENERAAVVGEQQSTPSKDTRPSTQDVIGIEASEAGHGYSEPVVVTPPTQAFSCDGRIYCSQMTSCEEAKFFLQNCPGVKMDGGRSNGIPCETQWCN